MIASEFGFWGQHVRSDQSTLVSTVPAPHVCAAIQVEADIEAAKKGEFPPIEDLWNNIYADGLGAKLRPIEISKPKIQLWNSVLHSPEAAALSTLVGSWSLYVCLGVYVSWCVCVLWVASEKVDVFMYCSLQRTYHGV